MHLDFLLQKHWSSSFGYLLICLYILTVRKSIRFIFTGLKCSTCSNRTSNDKSRMLVCLQCSLMFCGGSLYDKFNDKCSLFMDCTYSHYTNANHFICKMNILFLLIVFELKSCSLLCLPCQGLVGSSIFNRLWLLGTRSSISTITDVPLGLFNLGKTCFLNCILQVAFLNNPCLKRFFLSSGHVSYECSLSQDSRY